MNIENKIVFLGNEGVGKSSIISRFKYNKFKVESSTIGAAFTTCIEPTTQVKLNIWDTAGQEKYDSLTPMYYRNAKIAIIVYSTTEKHTYNKAQLWNKKIQENSNNCEIILVENKVDKIENDDDNNNDNDNFDDNFIKVSAKTGYNINKLFEKIGNKIIEINKTGKLDNKSDDNNSNKINNLNNNKKNCCN